MIWYAPLVALAVGQHPATAPQPPPDSPPLVRFVEIAFPTQNGVTLVEPATYLYYLETKPSLPSQGLWRAYDEKVALADFRRLWATGFLDNLWVDVRDEPYDKGVIGNQPDEVLEFDWHTSFSITLTFSDQATSSDADISFPVSILSASIKVEQASGGIVTPPTGGEVEHYDSAISQVTASQVTGVGVPIALSFDVWYDLPSLRKEALITVTVKFKDSDDQVFSRDIAVIVDP